jgi:hypothetical protein
VNVLRVFLTVWLAAFAVQTTDLLATVVPDGCVEETRGSAADPCPENCARCVCCARLPIFIPQIESPASDVPVNPVSLPPIQRSTISVSQPIFHVPKAL